MFEATEHSVHFKKIWYVNQVGRFCIFDRIECRGQRRMHGIYINQYPKRISCSRVGLILWHKCHKITCVSTLSFFHLKIAFPIWFQIALINLVGMKKIGSTKWAVDHPLLDVSCTHINLDSIITYLFEARAPLWITLLVTIKCKFISFSWLCCNLNSRPIPLRFIGAFIWIDL